jgi:hypothetical protein
MAAWNASRLSSLLAGDSPGDDPRALSLLSGGEKVHFGELNGPHQLTEKRLGVRASVRSIQCGVASDPAVQVLDKRDERGPGCAGERTGDEQPILSMGVGCGIGACRNDFRRAQARRPSVGITLSSACSSAPSPVGRENESLRGGRTVHQLQAVPRAVVREEPHSSTQQRGMDHKPVLVDEVLRHQRLS